MKEWKRQILKDFINFNPQESISKKKVTKKIAMDKLNSFQRKISGYELANFAGGSKFRNGDTLLSRITPCLENGKTAKVDILEDTEIAFGSTEFIVLRNIDGISDKDFIYYLATSNTFREIAIKSMVGTSGRQRVQQSVVENFELFLPPLAEQEAIAEVLSSLDDKIELNNKINKILEEMAQAIFKNWFIDFEFPNENGLPYKSSGGEFIDSELGKIPKDWEVAGLDDIAEYLNGLAMQKYKPQSFEDSLPVLKIKELRQGATDKSSDRCKTDIPNDYIIEDGDIIFSWSGSLMIDVWCGGSAGLNQHLFKVTSKRFDKWFYFMWIKHHMSSFVAIAKDKQTTMGHIKREHLSKALVVIPNKKEYLNISNLLQSIFDEVINNNLQSKTLASLRDTLLPKLMSGEIRVKK